MVGFSGLARGSIPTRFGGSFSLGGLPPSGVCGSSGSAGRSADPAGSEEGLELCPWLLMASENVAGSKPVAGGLAGRGPARFPTFSLLGVCQG